MTLYSRKRYTFGDDQLLAGCVPIHFLNAKTLRVWNEWRIDLFQVVYHLIFKASYTAPTQGQRVDWVVYHLIPKASYTAQWRVALPQLVVYHLVSKVCYTIKVHRLSFSFVMYHLISKVCYTPYGIIAYYNPLCTTLFPRWITPDTSKNAVL